MEEGVEAENKPNSKKFFQLHRRNDQIRQILEDMMYYTTKFRFLAKPNCKPNLKFSKKTRTKTRYETHKTGWYLDFRIVFSPSLKHEIPNLVYDLDQLRKKIWSCSQLGPSHQHCARIGRLHQQPHLPFARVIGDTAKISRNISTTNFKTDTKRIFEMKVSQRVKNAELRSPN